MIRLAMVAPLLLCAAACAPAFHEGPMPGEPEDSLFIEVDGTRVRYRDEGTGPAVVLLHGFASSLDTWDDLVPVLAERHRVIALDLRGFGWTDRPDSDYSPLGQARLVLALLDALGVGRAAVVGHSWGSAVAMTLALHAPDRVARMALFSAWVYEEQLPSLFLWAREPGVGEALFALYYRERAEDKLQAAFYRPELLTQGLVDAVERALERPGTVAAALAAVRGQTLTALQAQYPNVQAPVLLLWGREDRVARLRYGERLATELPSSRLVVYPFCGHFPMIEARDASTRDLAAFLAEAQP